MSELHRIPKSWQWIKLNDVADVVTGNTPPTSDFENYGGQIPFFKPPQLNDSSLYEAPEALTEKGLKKARLLPENTVLVSCIGILGKTAITKTPSTTNQQINAVIFHSAIEPNYGFYHAQTLTTWLNEHSSATTVAIINKGKFESAPFPLAPHREQTRIVAKLEELLSDLDAGVTELKTAQKKLAQYRQSLLKAAVDGNLTAEWRKNNPPIETGAELLERILKERRTRWEAKQLAKFQEQGKTPPKDWQHKYAEPNPPAKVGLFDLPGNWSWSSVEQLAELVSGHTPKDAESCSNSGGDIGWFKVGDMNKPGNDVWLTNAEIKFDLQTALSLGMKPAPKGTIVFPKRGGAIATNKKRRLANMSCFDLNTMGLIPSPHVADWLWSYFQGIDLGQLSSGSNVPQINNPDIAPLCVPLPPIDEQLEIICLLTLQLESTFEQEKSIHKSLKQAAAQRQNILRAAFAGQLVPQDPNDEPASVLLERIRAERASQASTKKARTSKSRKAAT